MSATPAPLLAPSRQSCLADSQAHDADVAIRNGTSSETGEEAARPARINALVSLHQNRNETIPVSARSFDQDCLTKIVLYRICAVNGDMHWSAAG
jgi:hypothetical protein